MTTQNDKSQNSTSPDYRSTLLLPRTSFSMRARLSEKETALIKEWQKIDLEGQIRKVSKNRDKFVLHDGPPYANGHLHMGHALNKILKDIILRSFRMFGYNCVYVPGWDCHGLPIEWCVEEECNRAGKNKDEIPIVKFRQLCRDFASKWIKIQSAEFQRLGISGDWSLAYTTMSYNSEAKIASELLSLFSKDYIYRTSKPVMWSVAERTALAEAEIEYKNYKSDMVWVGFPIVNFELSGANDIAGSSDVSPDISSDIKSDVLVVIWTTTPWTLPSNRAIAYHKNIKYGIYRVLDAPADNWLVKDRHIVIADILAPVVFKQCRVAKWQRLSSIDPKNMICAHPLRGRGYDFDVPLLEADFVTSSEGTGFVHVAPEHGPDDYYLSKRFNIETSDNLAPDSSYKPHVPLFAGLRVYNDDGKKGDANIKVMEALLQSGCLLAKSFLTHKYPHSWRSKAPILFLNTKQWFVSMQDDKSAEGLRHRALSAIDKIRFVPQNGYKRLYEMVKTRPDWVISRQRSWGVPICVFTEKKTGEVLIDKQVNQRIIDAFKEYGADIWYEKSSEFFLGKDYDASCYDKNMDILDVWFESGTSFSFVLEENKDLRYPADLYLEGSDQHRGWFQSSLLISTATRNQAPYRGLLTHGFVVDANGRKMSKSLGNTISPQDIINRHGAEILRLWVASSDYKEDMSISNEIIRQNVDNYRKIRNTLRFLLGNLNFDNLNHFDADKKIDFASFPSVERYILSRIADLDVKIRNFYKNYEFKNIFKSLFNFCIVDLSSFYFDLRKDCLYCDSATSTKRIACIQTLDILFCYLTRFLSPILCFTCEEAHKIRYPGSDVSSIHLQTFMKIPSNWRDEALEEKWQILRKARQIVNGAIELDRKSGNIGSSLEASVDLYVSDDNYRKYFDDIDLAEIFITSEASVKFEKAPKDAFCNKEIADNISVITRKAKGHKCARCWRILEEVGTDPEFLDLCLRDAAIMRNLPKTEPVLKQ